MLVKYGLGEYNAFLYMINMLVMSQIILQKWRLHNSSKQSVVLFVTQATERFILSFGKWRNGKVRETYFA